MSDLLDSPYQDPLGDRFTEHDAVLLVIVAILIALIWV